MIQKKKVRVVVTQGYCLLRKALIERLEKETWIEVCAVASEVGETREMIQLHRPDVLVINVSLKCSSGVSSLRKLKTDFFGLTIVALSCDSEFENQYVGQAMRAGADGYISSVDSIENLIHAIWAVKTGGGYMSHQTEALHKKNAKGELMLSELSRREAEVFCLTGCGYVPKRIAERMDLSVKTIESYRERIRKKMNISNGADLLYSATGFMRSAARRGVKGSDDLVIKKLLSAIS
ncbi:MAG: response regulator transcription factor [Pontiella sp.]